MQAQIRKSLQAIVIVACLLLVATVSGSSVGASDGDEITWQIEIKAAFTSDQIKQPGWEENTRAMQNALPSRLQTNNTRLNIQRAEQAGGAEFTFRADGKGTAAQFKRVAFDDLSPIGGLIGGPAALTLNGAVKRGESLTVALESNPSTGYTWDASQVDAAMLQSVGTSQFQQKASMPGAPAKQTIKLNAAQDGSATVTLSYRRPWETETPTRRVTLSAARLASLADITNPSAPSSDQTQAAALPVRPPTGVGALPASFDWRNNGGVNYITPIRDQGTCGSCWAFASVGAFESNILYKDGYSRDLSEQYLVSCNTDGWGCSGGWWGHKYHYNTLGQGQTTPGAVYESAFPYVAADAACSSTYSHPYQLNNWYYVGTQYTIPAVDAIKNAIYYYGPVSVALCAGNNFHGYTSGILSGNDASYCSPGVINHAVDLVGWNDTDGTWILRNSWGTGWGESGYARILRNISNVGYNASYVYYSPTQTCYDLTTSASPSGGGGVSASPAPNCHDTQYTPGTVVTVRATPSCGRSFLSWTGNLSGSTNPTTITMNSSKNITANFSASSSPCFFRLPFILKSNSSPSGISGRVLYNGTPIGGISLLLRFYNGSSWSTYTTTTTAADGTYGFTGMPSLTSGQYYYVKFLNTSVASGGNSNYLWYRGSPYLSTYTAGSQVTNADMDIANVPMTAPTNGSTVSLPYTFQWTRRTGAPSDSYELDLYDASGTPYWYTYPSLGYVGSYTLNSRPSGFTTGVQYDWDMWVYAPDGGDGYSYYYRTVTFAAGSAAPQEAAPRLPKKADADFIPPNRPAP